MEIEDIHKLDLCEDIRKDELEVVVKMLNDDGFNISGFTLYQIENGVWDFVSTKDSGRGFQLFYDPKAVNKPIPQYQLHNGNIYFSFNARNITEAYILHGKEIDDEDYMLLSKTYGKTENEQITKALECYREYGLSPMTDMHNRTKEWLEAQLSGSSMP